MRVQRREYHGAPPDVHGEAEVDVGLHVVGEVRDSVPRKVRGRGGRQVPHLTQVVSVTFSRWQNFRSLLFRDEMSLESWLVTTDSLGTFLMREVESRVTKSMTHLVIRGWTLL